jgi:hypothetical protein
MPYRWSESEGRYRDARGRYVADSTVRRVVDQVADEASARLARAAQRLLDGEISLASFQLELMQTAKAAMLAGGILARGGAAQMRPADYLAAAREIKRQYQYAREFADQVADGRQPLNGTIVSRARQYGQAARGHYAREWGRGQQQRGYQSVRNVLAPAEHCQQCRSLAARGWMPLDEMVPIGERTCRGNDRCRLEYRREPAEVAA